MKRYVSKFKDVAYFIWGGIFVGSLIAKDSTYIIASFFILLMINTIPNLDENDT